MCYKAFLPPATAWLGLVMLAGLNANGVTTEDLQKRLAAGERLTLIDIRSTDQFVEGHIPGAINIPASLCAQKHLPPLGKVIVYDAGLGLSQPDAAAAALAAKPGITVETLEGGFALWEASQSLTTRGHGMKSENLNYISYADLKVAKTSDILLVDLRESPDLRHPQTKTTTGSNPLDEPLTDLGREFPQFHQTRSPFGAKSFVKTSGASPGPAPLLVLIDNGDGTAQRMAQALKAQGMKRYAILAGGELILARHGQAGLQRNSPGSRSLNASSVSRDKAQ